MRAFITDQSQQKVQETIESIDTEFVRCRGALQAYIFRTRSYIGLFIHQADESIGKSAFGNH